MRGVGGQKCQLLSTLRVKNVHVEVGTWSKKDKIISTQLLNDPLSDRPFDAGTRRWTLKTAFDPADQLVAERNFQMA